MPFPPAVKARLFIRSARICSLCFKQCGTNIEVAHIVAEAAGGPNDDANGIPLCFDCHQEIGAYDNKHPKGNRFGEAELRARRDQLFELVESGSIQAQVIATRLHGSPEPPGGRTTATVAASVKSASAGPTVEARAVLNEALAAYRAPAALPGKLALLSEADRAWVLDQLLEGFARGSAIDILLAVASARAGDDSGLVLLEQLLRKVTLAGAVPLKAQFMRAVSADLLATADVALRETFFTEVVEMMERDQYEEVNLITPSVVDVQAAIPGPLTVRYVRALLDQARSGAYQGAPAAKAALLALPDSLLAQLFAVVDDKYLIWEARNVPMKELLRRCRPKWPEPKRSLYDDFVDLDAQAFAEKHWTQATQ